MTRKENLLKEVYNLRNQIAEVKGNEQVNIDELVQSYKFRDEAAEWKEYELQLRIEALTEGLEKVKVEATQRAAADAFYATDEGQAFRRECQEKRALLAAEYDTVESSTLINLEILINTTLGLNWKVGHLSTTNLELGIKGADGKFLFGQTTTIYYGYERWASQERFEINVGTCGSHELMPSESVGSMAAFYIGIGKLHADTEFLTTLRKLLYDYAERINNIEQEVRHLDAQIKNPKQA